MISRILNLTKILQETLKAIAFPMLGTGTDDSLQFAHDLGSQVLIAFQKITEIRNTLTSPEQQLQSILSVIAETFNFPLVLIEQYDADREQLCPIGAQGVSLTSTHQKACTPVAQSLSGTVILTQQPTVWAEPADPISLPQLLGLELFASSFHTVIGLPLISHQQALGVLTLAHPEYRSVEPYVLHWLNCLATHAVSVLAEIQTHQTQHQAQERLELTALGIQGVMYDLNLEDRQISRTEGLMTLLGYEASEIEPSLNWWLGLIHPSDQLDFRIFLEHGAQDHQEFALSYQVRRKNDEYVILSDRGVVLHNKEGVPLRIVGTLTASVPKAIAAIDSEPLTQLLEVAPASPLSLSIQPSLNPAILFLDRIQDVIFQTNVEGQWTFLNQSWTTLTGFSIAETLGKSWKDFIHPEDVLAHQNRCLAMAEGKQDNQYQIRYLTQAGEPLWVEVHCQPLLNPAGNFEGVAGTIHDITERKTVETQLVHSAMHDSLTSLPNRTLFMDRLHHAYQNYRRYRDIGFAVLFLDLDRFKVINDSLGHIVGDELLQSVSERLQNCLRPGDTVSRFGGDEFTVLLLNITKQEDAIQVSDRILTQLSQPFYLNGNQEVFTSSSIGIALSLSPEQPPDELLRHADIALYRAKNNGKGRHEIFVPAMQAHTLEQLELETDLHRAIERQELKVYYQPIYTLPQQKLAGFEAFLRWEHPKRGLLIPADFLAIAEETGLVVNIGGWVLRSACKQLQQWQQDYHLPLHLFMSVNISPQQIATVDFVEQVQQTLTNLQLNPSCLMLEIDEIALAQEAEGAIQSVSLSESPNLAKLKLLKDIGVQLCLDEFGRRFSSFGDFSRFPLSTLKIDRSLVGEMHKGKNLELVRSILTLGHKLKLKVIAEGIENEPQIAQLQALKCNYGQGHFFGLAALPQNLSTLLEERFLTDSPPIALLSPVTPILIIRTPTNYAHIPLVGGKSWSMGRSVDSTVVLTDRWVSRNHAEIQQMDNGEYYLVDLGSGNGSFVNGQRVTMPVHLKDTDLLTIGRTEIEFQCQEPGLSTQIQDDSVKTVLMVQAAQKQGDIWREALSSQNISLVCINAEVDLQELIQRRVEVGESLPDLLLLDMTTLRPNPYSFCRWCHAQYPQLKIILTSGTRTDVPPSERQWAIYQGALDLLSAFPEDNLFSNIVDITTKIRSVLNRLDSHPISQQSLASALMSIQSIINRDTLFPTGDSK
jgi:diguanylate cyclase (GGDEF)-like protein/PAS domain S-box-containing protein